MWITTHIITRLELGGAQLATLYEAAHSRFGAWPTYLIYGPGGMLDDDAQALAGIVCLPVPALSRAIDPTDDMRAFVQICRQLRAIQKRHPDAQLLVHTHSSKAGILGRWAARAVGAARVVHSIHGFGHHLERMRTPIFRALALSEQLTARITHGFTADSAANLQRARSEKLLSGQPAEVVRCGIDVQAFVTPSRSPSAVRAELGIPAHHRVVLQLACLKPQKDPLTFVDIAARLAPRHPDVTYLLAGDGELRDAVARRCSHLGLRHVHLLGWRRDAPDLLHASDLLVLTSLWEGLPQVFPQAMAAGKPIVATCVDGAPEAIVDGETGYLAPVQDVAALAAGVERLLVDPVLRQRFGEAGRKRVAAFSQEEMVRALDAFYTTVAANRLRA